MSAPAQYLFAKLGAVLELTKICSVAGGHHWNIREKTPRQGTEQPVVMAVDDIRPETGHCFCQHTCKNRFVCFDILRGQIDKPRTWVGHDIRHAGDQEWNVAPVEADKAALFQGNTVEFDVSVGLNTSDHKIIMTTFGCFTHN